MERTPAFRVKLVAQPLSRILMCTSFALMYKNVNEIRLLTPQKGIGLWYFLLNAMCHLWLMTSPCRQCFCCTYTASRRSIFRTCCH